MEQILPEGPIKLGTTGIRRLILGIAFAALPALASLIYFDFQSSEHTRETQSQRLIENAVSQRAALIKHDHDVLISHVEETLGTAAEGQIEIALKRAVPNANTWQVVPLDDMGVASLLPADYGLGSLVLLDRVRQVFNTGNSQFEVIRQNNNVKLALVSRFSSQNAEGVAIVTFSSDLVHRWISQAPVGDFSLWQRMGDTQNNLIAGPDKRAQPQNVRAITGTDWALSLQPTGELIPPQANINPLLWLSILGGVLVAVWLCIAEPKRLLAANVKRISEAADNRSPLMLDFPELAPLALTLRQLSSNKKLRDKRAPIEHESEQVIAENRPAEQPVEKVIKAPWTLSKDSWIALPPISVAEESKAIIELARGITSSTLKGPNRSFALSSLGDELARDPKTKLTKALLSCGIDIVDLNDAPLPVVQMATHDATASGSALVMTRDQTGTLKVGAIVNRAWVASSFWQHILSVPLDAENISGNGRSVKFSLESEYCERVASDIALAESLKIIVSSDNLPMLELAEKSLKSMLCDVVTHRANLQDATMRMESWLTSEAADAGIFIDASESRLAVFDEKGHRISDDHMLMLIIQDTLARHPGCDVLIGPKASRSLPPFIGNCGGASTVVTCRPQVIHQEMQAKGALVAGDSAGAIFIKDRWYGANDPLYGAARIAEIVSNSDKQLSALVATLPVTAVREIRLTDSPELQGALVEILSDEGNFAGARISRIDGVRVDFADSWVHIQSAEDTVDVQLRFEGDDVECCDRLSTLLVNILERNHPDLALLLRDALAATT